MSITPKRIDIQNRKLPDDVVASNSKISFQDNDINIEIYNNDTHDLLATYRYHVPNFNQQDNLIGIMEGLVIARLATEALVNVVHKCTYPMPEGYDDLLSKFGMAEIRFVGSKYIPDKPSNKQDTLMFSGGADSSHILFSRLHGKCNLVSFEHGQSNFRAGVHSEEAASRLVPLLARKYFQLPIDQTFVKARWKCYLPRKYAKAYRNMMFMTHAATVYPNTRLNIGTSKDDRLHDSFPDFIEGYTLITGIEVTAPNLNTGRDIIMRDLINASLEHIPYYYASTSSCQLQRYTGKKYLQEGSCHSCLLRLPAAVLGGDPRFSNFNTNIKLIPEYLEDEFKSEHYYMRKPSKNALKTFFDDLGTYNGIFDDFKPTIKLIETDWKIKPSLFLTKEQLSMYN